MARKSERLEWAPLLLRYAPIAVILTLVAAESWHLWGPIWVKELPGAFDLTCTGDVTGYRDDGYRVSEPQPWNPRYHVDLRRRTVDAVYIGKRIHIGSVDRKHGALWLEDESSKTAGRNIVSYFYRKDGLFGSLASGTRGSITQVKRATCVRTPAT